MIKLTCVSLAIQSEHTVYVKYSDIIFMYYNTEKERTHITLSYSTCIFVKESPEEIIKLSLGYK